MLHSKVCMIDIEFERAFFDEFFVPENKSIDVGIHAFELLDALSENDNLTDVLIELYEDRNIKMSDSGKSLYLQKYFCITVQNKLFRKTTQVFIGAYIGDDERIRRSPAFDTRVTIALQSGVFKALLENISELREFTAIDFIVKNNRFFLYGKPGVISVELECKQLGSININAPADEIIQVPYRYDYLASFSSLDGVFGSAVLLHFDNVKPLTVLYSFDHVTVRFHLAPSVE